MGEMDFLSAKEFSIPVAQIVGYVFLTTICFFLKRYKLGLMLSFSFVFYWGFLNASENFVDMMGNPTAGLIIYLFSGFVMVVLVLIGFSREE